MEILLNGAVMDKLEDRIRRHEGLRLFPYLDTEGYLTIGWGRNLSETGISPQEANTMLQNDIDRAAQKYSNLPDFIRHKCNDTRCEVLIEMIFQLGYSGLLGFKKMFVAVHAGDFDQAANEMINSLWGRQTPNRCHELAGKMRSGV
jgi:lysozyme